MSAGKTSFHLRLDDNLMADLRAVSFNSDHDMSTHIRLALVQYLPSLLDDVPPAIRDAAARAP